MKTKEQIIQAFKYKLNTESKDLLVIKLKRPFSNIESQNKQPFHIPLVVKLTLIAYEKETDTVWLLGHDTTEQFIKISMANVIDQNKEIHKALDQLSEELGTLSTTLIKR